MGDNCAGHAEGLEVIVEHGIIGPRYRDAASMDEAVGEASARGRVAWIAALDASLDEVEFIARAIGLGEWARLTLGHRRRSQHLPRARITRLERGVHLLVPGVQPDHAGVLRVDGHIELLATRDAIAVLSSGLPERMQPQAIRRRLEPSLPEADELSGNAVLGLVAAQLFEWFEDLLDDVEDEAIELAEGVFVRRGREQLERIYQLSRPVNVAVAALAPLLRGPEAAGQGLAAAVGILAEPLLAHVAHLSGRLERIAALLALAQQSYFSLAQDEANRLIQEQGNATRRISACCWSRSPRSSSLSTARTSTTFRCSESRGGME